MKKKVFLTVHNCDVVRLKDINDVSLQEFRDAVIDACGDGGRIISFFGKPEAHDAVRLFIVIADDKNGELFLLTTSVKDKYPCLTKTIVGAHWFEREIAEQWGIIPEGHPRLNPIRFHQSYRDKYDAWGRSPNEPIIPSVTAFNEVEGEEVHEVAVGPVHAGIIEPGHFRFQCHGEHVFQLEISLGYQHRGVEKALVGGPNKRTMHYMETLAGDTTIAHATAYCQMIESFGHPNVPVRAQVLRGIALELERLANHTGDLGALSNDVAYLPTAAYCGRLRGDFLNMTAELCGNRFGRGLLVPGGVAFDIDDAGRKQLLKKLEKTFSDLTEAVNLLWDTPSVVERFESTGVVRREICDNLGLVGPAARACGVERDVRFDFPMGIFRFTQIPVSTQTAGDVLSRAYVRWFEAQKSVEFIQNQLKSLPEGHIRSKVNPSVPDAVCVSLVEGWRGEICHTMITDRDGNIAHYKIVDPSFHNWMGLEVALKNEEISNFPLCNKSFNLSYCGHDL